MKSLALKNLMTIFTFAIAMIISFQSSAEQNSQFDKSSMRNYQASQSDLDQEQQLIEHAEQNDQQAELVNPLWGFRCNTTDNESVITVTIKDKAIKSVMLLNYTDDQLIATRGVPLNEVAAHTFSGSYKPMLLSTNSAEELTDLTVTPETTLTAQPSPEYTNSEQGSQQQENQFISYEVQIAVDLEDSEQPKIETSALIKNGQLQAELNCKPLYHFHKRSLASR